MGIKYLNRYLKEKCSNKSIYTICLEFLKEKTIVVDTSIYLYKFIENNTLIEEMTEMINLFKIYNINPIFIFDGKPPIEKKELLVKRKNEKNEAKQKYEELLIYLNSLIETKENEKKNIKLELKKLQKQCLFITHEDINNVKELMNTLHVSYIDAVGEAELLCSYYVNTNNAYACLSDDMDLFLYGCYRVLRCINLKNKTVMFYDTNLIFNELNMNIDIFREIIVISGTDYNINNKTNIFETIKWYYQYLKYTSTYKYKKLTFYCWLIKNTKYIKHLDNVEKFNSVIKLYDVNYTPNI